ncbi:hypothetical protein, partial [Rhodoblastus sp.]|uniref:hypothetical protein n=1 Tax=Rhodoblastus sp. TaxID=1962975 RepID=UPI003F9CDD2B
IRNFAKIAPKLTWSRLRLGRIAIDSSGRNLTLISHPGMTQNGGKGTTAESLVREEYRTKARRPGYAFRTLLDLRLGKRSLAQFGRRRPDV